MASRLDKVEQGFISQNKVLPSDLSLDIVTEIRKLKTSGAIILSVSAASPVFNSLLMQSLSILVHPEADPGARVTHQVKLTSEQELKIRFRVTEEGVYMVSIRLYNHHIRQSPLLLPVLGDLDQGLAKLGLLASSDNLHTTNQNVASDLSKNESESVIVQCQESSLTNVKIQEDSQSQKCLNCGNLVCLSGSYLKNPVVGIRSTWAVAEKYKDKMCTIVRIVRMRVLVLHDIDIDPGNTNDTLFQQCIMYRINTNSGKPRFTIDCHSPASLSSQKLISLLIDSQKQVTASMLLTCLNVRPNP